MKYRGVVIADKEENLFAEFREVSCQCRALLAAGEGLLLSWPELLEDLFLSLYLPKPVFRGEEELKPLFFLNRWILEGFAETSDYGQLRVLTAGSFVGSCLACLNVGWYIFDHLDREAARHGNTVFHWGGEAEKALLHALTWEKIAAVAGRLAGKGLTLPDRDFHGELARWRQRDIFCRGKVEQALAGLREYLAQADQPGRFDPSDRDKLQKEINQTKLAEGAWGTNSSNWDRKPRRDQGQLLEKISRSAKLKRLTERLGRLQRVKAEAVPGRDAFPSEIWGLETGNDLERLLPEEALTFLRPRWKKLFYRNFAEESLSVYRYRQAEDKRKGPMIICIDNSGSMQGPKEEVSKVLALSMADIAARDKRDLTVLMFGGAGDEIKVFEAPGGALVVADRMAMAEYFLCSSGTNYTQPLQKALECLEKKQFARGDVIFITDGICRLDGSFLPTFREAKKKLGFKTTCVLIHYGKFTPEGVADFGDEILVSKDLMGHDVAPALWGRFG